MKKKNNKDFREQRELDEFNEEFEDEDD